jgi:hypothetical protein
MGIFSHKQRSFPGQEYLRSQIDHSIQSVIFRNARGREDNGRDVVAKGINIAGMGARD